MEVEEIKEETLEVKPKTKKRSKKNPEEIINEPVSRVKKSPKNAKKSIKTKTTSTIKKKKTSTLKKKKVVEDNIDVGKSITETPAQSINSAAEVEDELTNGLKSQPMGQAELPDKQAEVYVKNSDIKNNVICPTEHSLSGKDKLEITQTADSHLILFLVLFVE
jgi:hypothetical protein